MDLINFLHKELKSEPLNELFETYDVEVIYEYDRSYEGMDDEYWAKIPSLGLQFVFDKNQNLQTIFVFLKKEDGVSSANMHDLNMTNFTTKADATQFALTRNISFDEGKAEFFGDIRDWIKLKFGSYSIHYEYRDSTLSLITLQAEYA